MSSASIFRASLRCFAAIALLMLASIASARAADPCPTTLLLESSNAQYYVAVFSAPVKMKASIGITLYSKSNGYTASVTQLSIDTPWNSADPENAYRSYTTVFKNPGELPFLGAVVHPYDMPHNTICPTEAWIVPSTDAVRAQSKAHGGTAGALEQAVIDEAGDGSGAFPLTPIAVPPVFACAVPFDEGHILSFVKADYPKAPGAPRFAAQVRVDITDEGLVKTATISRSSGNADFDTAALAAAKKTTYAPRVFGCNREAATFFFTSAE